MDEDVSVPDTDDWTWVLEQRCPQCRIEVGALSARELPQIAADYVHRFRELLETGTDVAVRPDLKTWSVLEYGAHLRDVSEVFRTRVRAMLLREGPSYEDWDQEQAAKDGQYSVLDPIGVADDLRISAGDLLRDAGALSAEELQREGYRSDGYTFTIETLLQYYLHELVHHWWDVSGEEYE